MGARRGSGQPRSAIPPGLTRSHQLNTEALSSPAPGSKHQPGTQLQSRPRSRGRGHGDTGDTRQPAGTCGSAPRAGTARNLAERRGGPRSPQLHPAQLPSLPPSLLFPPPLPSRRGGAAAATPPLPSRPLCHLGGGGAGAGAARLHCR